MENNAFWSPSLLLTIQKETQAVTKSITTCLLHKGIQERSSDCDPTKSMLHVSREAVDASLMEVFKTGLDGALSKLV